jgi:Bacterial Ig domain
VEPQISDFIPVDSSNGFVFVYQFADNANGYSWSDGTPTASVTNSTTGVWAYGTPLIGSGFQMSAPADTATRTLKVYVGAFKARGQLEAYLSDGSASAYFNSSLVNLGNGPSGVYTITYSAASAGQQLIVRWTMLMPRGADGNVTLQAAALTSSSANNPPFVALTSPANNASLSAGGTITLAATADDLDGTVSKVEFFQGATKLGEDSTSPYTFDWTDVPAGFYVLSARATDDEGLVSYSSPVEIFVNGTGGSLAGSIALPPALPRMVNLSTEGTRDWIHWGLTTNNLVNRKGGVTPQISDFTKIGTNAAERFADNYTSFSWSDGTPAAAVGGTPTGVFTFGLNEGFEITVPADTSMRTLKLYVGLYGAQGNFQAWLTDLSAPAYTDTTLSSLGNNYAAYSLTYAAASPGQALVVWYRSLNLFDSDFGNITLQAATLVSGNEPTPVTIINPSLNGAGFQFSFVTEAGRSYTVQFNELLPAVTWQTLTNFTGTGTSAVVTDPESNRAQRFYRVRVE